MIYKPCKMHALNGDIANVECPASQPAVQQPTTTTPASATCTIGRTPPAAFEKLYR